jgi:F0F1-type ATP synthase delta subunit
VEHCTHSLQELQREHASVLVEHASLQSTNDELRGKLEDSKQQLKGNEQMIRWLNSQACSHPCQ